ncbi:restriction endonuclease subunit S [Paracoccus subflavus]|uniref:Restriction endonuclease subunit S n=1 Tax=Paracoccus subflavus TaxID=2528244 RepID=A0A4Q9FXB3_9RHOB|nr:restriction endonuclease subunit S [Paracoccus subflavus]TBN38624.1 restriction endonuclease subunit S [Paracoccus subflavus]
MTPDWSVEKLGGLVDAARGISYGIVQPGEHQPDGIPIVRVSDLKGEIVEMSKPLRVAPAIEAAHARTRLRGGELIMSIVGTVGQTAIVDSSLAGWNVARAVAVIPVKKDIGPYWIRLALKGGPARAHIQDRLNTTVQATLNLRDLASLPIVMPPAPERETIAATLGALDDKIELNRKMNATLEAIARALFRDWFVDFGPTRAKMEGREPYFSPDLWSLFPDRLDAEGKPEGWEEKPLTEFFSIIGGGTPKTSITDFWDGPIPWFSVTDTPPNGSVFVTYTEKTISDAGLNGSSARLVPKGTTIISARGTVGNLAVASREMTFNQSCYGLRGAGSVGDYASYLIAQNMVSQLQAMAHGSVFSTITRQTFESLSLPMPSDRVLDAFEDAVSPMFDKILANVHESRTLAQTGDLLLPRLMSGELRVADLDSHKAEHA